MRYADYAYYKDVYEGTAIPESEFAGLSNKASSYIRYMTLGRSDRYCLLDAIRSATCAAADAAYEYMERLKKDGGKEIKSENNDGYSVTYVSSGTDGKTQTDIINKIMYDAAYPYLLPVGLLYKGVRYANKCGHYDL